MSHELEFQVRDERQLADLHARASALPLCGARFSLYDAGRLVMEYVLRDLTSQQASERLARVIEADRELARKLSIPAFVATALASESWQHAVSHALSTARAGYMRLSAVDLDPRLVSEFVRTHVQRAYFALELVVRYDGESTFARLLPLCVARETAGLVDFSALQRLSRAIDEPECGWRERAATHELDELVDLLHAFSQHVAPVERLYVVRSQSMVLFVVEGKLRALDCALACYENVWFGIDLDDGFAASSGRNALAERTRLHLVESDVPDEFVRAYVRWQRGRCERALVLDEAL